MLKNIENSFGMGVVRVTSENLLGPLNEAEKKFAPEFLFVAGDREILQHGGRVSVVGSRAASTDGLRRAEKLSSLLVSKGVVVVSGLAKGIDTMAHKTAIAAGGKTIAVLGTPLDIVSPRENASLQETIIEHHLCVSQFAEGTPVQPKNFVLRNRTMALLSDATVIVEASDKSGSLHQGWEALRLGRGLFIMKAVVEDESLSWPAEMLKYGARILSNELVEEFLEFLPKRSPGLLHEPVPF